MSTQVTPEQAADHLEDGRPHVVVGVDGSEESCRALRWGAYLSRATGARLNAVTIWHLPATYAWSEGYTYMPSTWDILGEAEKLLAQTVDAAFGADRPADLHQSAVEGRPTEALLELSRTATLLVVGSRGRGGFKGMVLGSVSAACAAHALCPVVVVHGEEPPVLP
jgi:nucleotide-binding universal stress UspA family protein